MTGLVLFSFSSIWRKICNTGNSKRCEHGLFTLFCWPQKTWTQVVYIRFSWFLWWYIADEWGLKWIKYEHCRWVGSWENYDGGNENLEAVAYKHSMCKAWHVICFRFFFTHHFKFFSQKHTETTSTPSTPWQMTSYGVFI